MRYSREAKAARQEAEKWGCTDFNLVQGGKHLKLNFTYQGRRYFTTHPCSGSDSLRGELNARKDVRRVIGLERTPVKGVRRKPKKRRHQEPTIEPPRLTVGKPGMDQLKDQVLKTISPDEAWRLFWETMKRDVENRETENYPEQSKK